jgi:predicted flavoprotein YhiN
VFTAPALVVASGGLSIPKLGATSFGYDLARQFGLRIVPPRPALVPLVFHGSDRERWCDLAGVAAEVTASFGPRSFDERMLITHRGLSGPAILQVSSYWDGRGAIRIAPHEMPKRLAKRWYESGLEEIWELTPAGTEGFAKAEVTAGGVDTNELSSKTMEARNVPGLYFIGEVVDVTGHLGGFNFQWAWASGYSAGQAI